MGAKYLKKDWDFEKDPSFYGELALLEAQEVIARLMAENNVSESKLAKRLGKPKSYVEEILSEGQKLTLKALGRICFALGARPRFASCHIEEPEKSWHFPEYFLQNHAKAYSSWTDPFPIAAPPEEGLDNIRQQLGSGPGYCFQKENQIINNTENYIAKAA